MNKSELVDVIAKGCGISKNDTSKMIEMLISTVTDTLRHGGQIILPSFGSFTVIHRLARKGRNPQTGESIEIPASKVPKFKAGKSLKEAVREVAQES